MKLKVIVIVIVSIALMVGIVKFFGSIEEKYEDSESYVGKSIRAVKKVEALKEDRAETVSEQERNIEDW